MLESVIAETANGLVKESSDGAQQSAKACQDLSGLALDLQKMVGNFKLGGDGPGRRRQTKFKKQLEEDVAEAKTPRAFAAAQ